MDVQSESVADNWGRKQENCEPHLSKESHRFLAGNIVIRALGAIAIRYHIPFSGHAIFFIFVDTHLEFWISGHDGALSRR